MAMVKGSFFTGIVDVSHHEDGVLDFQAFKTAGGVAAIHKATEGLTYKDPRYAARKAAAQAAGLLWGSYHYSGDVNEDGTQQADHYLAVTSPAPDEMVCFDCEKHGTFANMEKFVLRVQEKLGRLPVIYGRNLLRDLMRHEPASIVTQCALWYDEYPPDPLNVPRGELPFGWKKWTIWQFTDGKHGPTIPDPSDPKKPYSTPGVGNVDRSAFDGSADDFKTLWPLSFAPTGGAGV